MGQRGKYGDLGYAQVYNRAVQKFRRRAAFSAFVSGISKAELEARLETYALLMPALVRQGSNSSMAARQRNNDTSFRPLTGHWSGREVALKRRMILRLLQRHCGLWASQGRFRALWWFRWGRWTIRSDNQRQGA